MYKYFDYTCQECTVTEERMVSASEEDNVAHGCGSKMIKEVPGPRGRVVGSQTPVKQ